MPFKKIGKDSYKSSSGKKYTKKQIQAYHATDGRKKKGSIKRAMKNKR